IAAGSKVRYPGFPRWHRASPNETAGARVGASRKVMYFAGRLSVAQEGRVSHGSARLERTARAGQNGPPKGGPPACGDRSGIHRGEHGVLLRAQELIEALQARVQPARFLGAACAHHLALEIPVDLEHVAELVGAGETEAPERIRLD